MFFNLKATVMKNGFNLPPETKATLKIHEAPERRSKSVHVLGYEFHFVLIKTNGCEWKKMLAHILVRFVFDPILLAS